jgi:hypothetical protein
VEGGGETPSDRAHLPCVGSAFVVAWWHRLVSQGVAHLLHQVQEGGTHVVLISTLILERLTQCQQRHVSV